MTASHITAMLVCALGAGSARAASDDNPYSDPPPLQATRGIADCPPPKVRAMTPEQARLEAHQRAERGTSCWLAGKCAAGGDYKDDDKVNRAVADAIAGDPRFAATSVWVETLRKFVTLKGCIADSSQAAALEAAARAVDGVKLVWVEAKPRGATDASKR